MSSRSEDDSADGQSVLDLLEDWYHVPVLVAVMGVMLAIRTQKYDAFIRGGEVFFSGNDAWYHLREVNYVVRNWPFTMPYDPWTYFPYGTSVGQFGTLYDQIVATAALILGLGSPTPELVAKTLLVAPAVFGALAAIPTYLLGKRLGGRFAGIFSAVILMLLPGTFLRRTLVGFADHNGVEPFFQALAVWGLLLAFLVAEREMPIWEVVREELIENRSVDTLREPLKWGAISGLLLGLYLWTWPPAVLLVGILGIFVLVHQTSKVVNESTPEPIAFATAVSMAVSAVMVLVKFETTSTTVTRLSTLHVLALLAVGAGSVFLAWLARYWDSRDLELSLYPVAVGGIGLVSIGAITVVAPDVLGVLQTNLLRTVGFSAGAQTRTIGEAQPYLDPDQLQRMGVTATGRIISDYGYALFTAVAASAWMLARPLLTSNDSRKVGYALGSLVVVLVVFLLPFVHRGIAETIGVNEQVFALLVVSALIVGATLQVEYDTTHLFLVVWAAFITSAAFTQVRFNYYLAVVVAVFNAFVIREVLRVVNLEDVSTNVLKEIEGYQVLAVIAAVMLILTPALVVPVGIGTGGSNVKSQTSWTAANQTGPGAVTVWDGSLDWMQNNTPAEGTLGGADNEMAYYGTYHAENNDFEYPNGAYGVQSWWDYGHWITVQGHRIPNANPFQEGATSAANYLLAPNESQAREVLASRSTEGENTRFVMVDWQMATVTSKFGAPVVFYDAEENVSQSDFYMPIYTQSEQGVRFGTYIHKQRYYDSMMVRLYQYHGSARDPTPLVLDWDEQTFQTRDGGQVTLNVKPSGNQSVLRSFDNMSAARQYVREDGSAQVGGFGDFPSERVPALEHYRLVRVSERSAQASRQYLTTMLRQQRVTGVPSQFLEATRPAWLKTFERVPGATVQGSGAPPNTTVTATVQLRIPTSNSTFAYTQEAQSNADGEFTLTLPYSTTDYDEYGPENGYTNVSVRAQGPYRVFSQPTTNESGYVTQYRSTLNVSEGDVNGAEDGTVSVTLEQNVTAPRRMETNGSSNTSGSLATPTVGLDGDDADADGTDTNGQAPVPAPAQSLEDPRERLASATEGRTALSFGIAP